MLPVAAARRAPGARRLRPRTASDRRRPRPRRRSRRGRRRSSGVDLYGQPCRHGGAIRAVASEHGSGSSRTPRRRTAPSIRGGARLARRHRRVQLLSGQEPRRLRRRRARSSPTTASSPTRSACCATSASAEVRARRDRRQRAPRHAPGGGAAREAPPPRRLERAAPAPCRRVHASCSRDAASTLPQAAEWAPAGLAPLRDRAASRDASREALAAERHRERDALPGPAPPPAGARRRSATRRRLPRRPSAWARTSALAADVPGAAAGRDRGAWRRRSRPVKQQLPEQQAAHEAPPSLVPAHLEIGERLKERRDRVVEPVRGAVATARRTASAVEKTGMRL